jgi:hypothetical protein
MASESVLIRGRTSIDDRCQPNVVMGEHQLIFVIHTLTHGKSSIDCPILFWLAAEGHQLIA